MNPIYANVTRKLILFSLFLFVFHGTVFASDLSSNANIFMYPKPLKIADLRLQSPSGQTVSLADFKGKVGTAAFLVDTMSSLPCGRASSPRGQEELRAGRPRNSVGKFSGFTAGYR